MGCTTSTVAPGKHVSSPQKINADQSHTAAVCEGLVYAEATDNSSNLFAAIKRGDHDTVKRMLGVYEINEGNATPNIIKVAKNVNNLIGMWNSTPLIVAVQYGQKEIADLLLAEPNLGDLNHRNEKGASVLLYACMEGQIDLVKVLLSKQVEISVLPSIDPLYNQATDSTVRCTPYSIAIVNGHQAVVALLIEAGMDVNLRFEFATLRSIVKHSISTAMDSVKDVPEIQHSAHISAHHIDRNTAHSQGALQLTPILLAAASGKLNVFRELLWRHADCSVVDSDGSTLLHHIARAKEDGSNMFRELKKNNQLKDASMEMRDLNGDTALLVACEGKQLELLQLLLEEGCSPIQTNSLTLASALHIAVKKRDIQCVNLLLEYGADPLLIDKNKVSALDLAMKLHKDSEIYKAMHTAGTAWKELRGLSHPAASAASATHNNPVTVAGSSTNIAENEHEISVLDASLGSNSSERSTVRVHTQPSAKLNNYTAEVESKGSPTNRSQKSSPMKSAVDRVQVYDSPEHVHIRPAEGVSKTPATNVRATDKVLEHLGRRASELQTQLADEENEESVEQKRSAPQKEPVAALDRRASVLTAEEENLMVDVDADGELIVEDAHLLEITGAPLTFSLPVCVPHHTPVAHAPPVHNKAFSFNEGSTKATFSGDAGASPAVSSINSANNSNSAMVGGIATPTGSAAISQASSLYRTGSFKTPVLPKRDFSENKTPLLRKSSIKSDTGSFKSPYMGTSGKKQMINSSESGTESVNAKIRTGTDEQAASNITSEIDTSAVPSTPTRDLGFSTPVKPSAEINTRDSVSGVTTPTHSAPSAAIVAGAQTSVKPSAAGTVTTTSTAVSQTAFVPRRPSVGPSQNEAVRPNVRGARYNALQKANSSSNQANKPTNGATGKTAKEAAAALPNIPKSELIVPVAPEAASIPEKDDSATTPRHIIASPPPKSVADANPFRRGSSVKKTTPIVDNSKK